MQGLNSQGLQSLLPWKVVEGTAKQLCLSEFANTD